MHRKISDALERTKLSAPNFIIDGQSTAVAITAHHPMTQEMRDASSDKTGALAGAIVGVIVALATLLAVLVARRATETHADATVPEATESESELETEPQMVTTTVLPTSRVLFRGPMLHCHNMVMQTETGSYVMETRVHRIRNGVVVGPGSQ